MIKIIGLRYGHSINCRGSRGKIDEVDSCKILFNKVKALLEAQGYIVIDCNSNASNVNAELNEGTNKANANKCDIYITLHMNAFNGEARGVECWCYDTNSNIAINIGNRICTNISSLGTPNRGVKYSKGYHDLNASNMQSIIVESIFCDNSQDVEIFNNKVDKLARAIANGIDNRISLEAPNSQPQVKMFRNIIVYNDGAVADQYCAEFFKMILMNANEDCECVSYSEYSKGLKDGRSIFAVGGSLEGKFKYHKIFKGINRNATALSMLEHLKKY